MFDRKALSRAPEGQLNFFCDKQYLALQRLERDARRYGWKAPDLPFLRYAELPPEMLADLPDEMLAHIPPELCMDVSAADIPVYPATDPEGVHGG